MHLKIKAENDILHMRYEDHTNYHVGDSGLDLFVPEEIVVPANAIGFQINHLISCEPFVDASKQNGMSYMLYPRSSMGARTPLRLSNSVGIMDAGYRGNVIAIVDNIDNKDFRVEAGTRLVQICDPTLQPITFEMVNSLSETTRGEGGLGSTG
tara:strand:- start:380 stop:838 length:459 start_codon:yes stop_codon:yes gene_type:complete